MCFVKKIYKNIADIICNMSINSKIKKQSSSENGNCITKNFFEFNKKKFGYHIINNEMYIDASSIENYFNLKNFKNLIEKNVDNNDVFSLVEIEEILNKGLKNIEFEKCNDEIYVNESGFYSLILSLDKNTTREFKNFVTKEIFPAIHKDGFYNIDKKTKVISNNMISFFNENEVSNFLNVNVFYMILVSSDSDGNSVIKYGHTNDFKNRFKSLSIHLEIKLRLFI